MTPTSLTADLVCDRALVGGRWVGASSGGSFPVTDPATGDEISRLPRMGTAETEEAIAAAAEALPAWRATPAATRARLLRRWTDAVVANLGPLSDLITAEEGKPLAEATAEVTYAASFLEWFGEQARRVYGEGIPAPAAESRMLVTREAIGVGACITPWNFPAAMITRKAGAALAAGCTIVVKPSERAPLTALALARLAHEAGIPPGVVNVVTGDRADAQAIGAALTASRAVRALSFTGSGPVGKQLMRDCADTVKRVSLELGGNSPFVVFDDADLGAAVEGILASSFRNAGQTCVSASRVLVQDRVHDELCERLAAATARLRVAPGREPGAQIGPLIDEAALAKVEAHVEDAVERGAHVLTGGGRHPLGRTFYQPTVLAGILPAMRFSCEETFGPVVGISRFSREADALRLANDTPTGLAMYAYTRDVGRLWRTIDRAEYGVIGMNTGLVSNATAPFGGMKESGLGREGGHQGLDEWLETKYVCLGGVDET